MTLPLKPPYMMVHSTVEEPRRRRVDASLQRHRLCQRGEGDIGLAIEPEAMMRGIDNPELGEIVPEVQRRLHAAVDRV